MTWLAKKAQCPLCKNTLISTDIYTISDEASTSKVEEEIINPNEYSMYFDKFKNFEILIKKKKEENVKILIFSNFESIFQNVIQILSKNNIMFEYIKGNGNQIKCTIDRYKTSTLNVLLVNSTNYGAGLNLENTDDIIMFHKFDIMSERQLIGRAQRHGRVNSLKIHYLLYENENSNIFNNI
jgi:SNF2 family DNA or RNA helicase